jgi:hypothetical protein
MIILMPLSAKEEDEGKLVNLDKVVIWGFFELLEGRVQKVEYFEDRNEYKEMIDVVVVADKNDYIWPFMEESIPILEAPIQREIEDVIEAFLFKELYEVNL